MRSKGLARAAVSLRWWSNGKRLQEAESEILVAAKRHRTSKISIAHFVAGGV